jgi:hypothetical protein
MACNRSKVGNTLTSTVSDLFNNTNIEILEPNRHVVIEDLRPETQYTIRVRGNDNLGPGKLSNAISAKTKEAGKTRVLGNYPLFIFSQTTGC